LLLPIFSIAISFFAIRLTSVELWGEFVSVMIIVQFVAHLASWGNKDYLLREFSRFPGRIAENWQISLLTRLVLLCGLCLIMVLLGYSWLRVSLMILWTAGIVIVQSYESLVLYRKAFLFSLWVETGAIFLLIIGVVSVGANNTIDKLLLLFAVIQILKAVIYVGRFREILSEFSIRIDLQYFRLAFPFFLLGFSGLLASRIDLYAVSYYMEERDVARYQVFINLMLYLQSVSAFIVTPYVKNIYRMENQTISKISRRLFVFGIVILIPALIIVYWLLITLYDIRFSVEFLALGGAFVLPIYAYLPLIHRLYKLNRTGIVLVVNLVGAGANLALNVILLPNIGVSGAILSSAVIQWAMLAVYVAEFRENHAYIVSSVSAID
jgi:O-antigen/teichoic acid export membrane protein